MPIIYLSIEYWIILGLTIFIIFLKFFFAGQLGKKVRARTRYTGKLELDLLYGIYLYTLLAGISRILFSFFDFVLTKFDTNLYPVYVWWWKIPMVISQLGVAILLFIIDRSIFKFKLKGVLGYLIAIIVFVQFFWPVHSKADFEFVSSFTFIVVIGGAIIPVLFFIIGFRVPGLRKNAFRNAWGIIFYSFAAIILTETILAPLTIIIGPYTQVVAFLMATILKSVGLLLLYFGTSNYWIK